MRELILNEIEKIRIKESHFDPSTMRWNSFWFNHRTCTGINIISRKEAKRSNSIHLSKTTRADFETMSDEALLSAFTLLIRQCSKQM